MANDFKRGIKVYLETSDYSKGMDAMAAATKKYEAEIQSLTEESKKMTAAGVNSGKAWDDNEKKLKSNKAALKKSQTAQEEFTAKLEQTKKVLNNLNGSTYNDLVKVQKQLQKELKDTTRDTDLHKTKLEQLDRVNKEVSKAQGEMNSKIGASGGFFSKAANGFNKYFTMGATLIAGITGMSFAFRKLAEDVAQMDDVYSDVMKTTGMTRDEVVALNEEFKKIDTRTSRESLNNLGRDAGKLGITGTKNILDFVDAGNQINVALGEDLGEDAIKNIGKMVGVFQNSTKQLQGIDLKGQMLAVGSAINQLGASSTASEPFLVSFAGRLGGISKQAKISMADILGYASALDQDMQAVEMSATAMQQFIMKVMGDTAKFAKLAGLEVKGFTQLLNTDANAAIKQVLRSMNEKGGFADLIPIFQEMGLDGARAVGVLSSMAGSIDKIDEAQRVANQSMADGISITKEYDIKNNNLAARLDKAKKAFQETSFELGEKLNPILLSSVKGTTYLIKALVELPKWLIANRGLLITLATVMAVYTVAVNAARIAKLADIAVDKLKLFWTKANTAATLVQVAVTGLLTGGTRAATLATKQLFNMLKINPYVALGIAIAAVVVGLYKLITQTKGLTETQKTMLELNESVNAEIERETFNLDAYRKRLMETEPHSQERIKLVAKLNELYPDLLAGIDAESASVSTLSTRIKDYVKNMGDSIRLKVLYGKITEKIGELEGETDYTKRTSLNSQIESLKKEYEYQLLVVDYGEKNAKLVSEKIALETHLSGLRVANQLYTSEAFETMWKSQNERNHIMYSSSKAEQDALNQAYSKYKNEQEGVEADLNKTNDKLLKINEILNKKPDVDTKVKDETKNNNNNDDKTKDKTDPYKLALDAREKAYKESQLELMELRRTGELTELNYNKIALQTQAQFLEDKKKLQEKYKQSTIDTEIEISTQKSKIQEDADKYILDAINIQQEAGLVALQSGEQTKTEMLQDALNLNIITEKEYNLEIKKLAVDLLAAKVALAEASISALEVADIKDKSVKDDAISKANAELVQLKGQLVQAQGDVAKDVAKGVEKNAESVAERMQKIFGNSFSSIGDMFASFTNGLDKLKNGDLKSWEDWAVSIGDIVQTSLAVATQVNDEYWSYKAASLEADKQRELANAGDNAEQREAINNKYAQKELDLKKKQSSADTVLKVAQAVAAGGLAIVQAFAQLGPIGGAIAAVLVGGITTLQVGTIMKQNAAIQATTLDSSATSGDSASMGTGERVVTAPQAASGRWDVVGAEDGKTYRNVPYRGVARTGIINSPTLVGEEPEIVIDNPTTRNIIMNAPWLLGEIKKHRVPQRASGKYDAVDSVGVGSSSSNTTDNATKVMLQENISVMHMVVALLQYLKDNGVNAWVLLSELEKKQILRDKSLNKGSLS